MRLPVSEQVLLNLLPIANFKTISIVVLVTSAIVSFLLYDTDGGV